MATRTQKLPAQFEPTDGPFLLALLIGARRGGDKARAEMARESLEKIGIRIQFAKDALALRPSRKGAARG